MHVLPELARLISGQSARQSFAGIWMLQDYPNHFVEKKCAVPLDISGVSSDIYIYIYIHGWSPQRPTFSLDLAVLRVFFHTFLHFKHWGILLPPPLPTQVWSCLSQVWTCLSQVWQVYLSGSKIQDFLGFLAQECWIRGFRGSKNQDFSRRVYGHLGSWILDPGLLDPRFLKKSLRASSSLSSVQTWGRMFRLGFRLNVSSAELCHSKSRIITRNYAMFHVFRPRWFARHRSCPALGSQASCLCRPFAIYRWHVDPSARTRHFAEQPGHFDAVCAQQRSIAREADFRSTAAGEGHATGQEVPVHDSRSPLRRKHLAAMMCNIQKGLKLKLIQCLGLGSYGRSQALEVFGKAEEDRGSETNHLVPPCACSSRCLILHLKSITSILHVTLAVALTRCMASTCVIRRPRYLMSWLWRMMYPIRHPLHRLLGLVRILRFLPRASERRVPPIVGVCISSSHLHIFLSSHPLIFTSSHLHTFSSSHLLTSHLLIFSSSHLLIFSSSHLHIFSSQHLLIFSSFTSSYLHILSSSHLLIFTPSHLHILHIFSSSHLHIL